MTLLSGRKGVKIAGIFPAEVVFAMFQGKNLFEILQSGGIALFVIAATSVLALAVLLERLFYYRRNSRVKREVLMEEVKAHLAAGDHAAAIASCDKSGAAFARVAKEGILHRELQEVKIKNAMDRRIAVEVRDLERFTNILGTLGGTVVYIGLFGTVLGIIRAFQEIAISAGGGGGMSLVIAGIAEALINTAAGIAVAVPCVIAYNILMKRVDSFRIDMELSASEIGDILR